MLLDPKKPSAQQTTISSKTRYKSTQLEANALRAVLGFGDKPVQAAKPKKQPKTNNKKLNIPYEVQLQISKPFTSSCHHITGECTE